MNTAFSQEQTVQEEAEIKAKIDDALAELKRINAEMVRDRAEFERLALETRSIAEDSRRMMARAQEIILQLEAV